MEPHENLSFDPSSYNQNSKVRLFLHYAEKRYSELVSNLDLEVSPTKAEILTIEKWFAKRVITEINWDLLKAPPSVELQVSLSDTLENLPCSFRLNSIFTTKKDWLQNKSTYQNLIEWYLPRWHKTEIHRGLIFGLSDIVVMAIRSNKPKKTKLTSNKRKRLRKRIITTNPSLKCVYCGTQTTYDGKNKFTLDHIIPNSKGGVWDVANLALACDVCNNERGDKYFELFLSEKRQSEGYKVNSLVL